MVPTGRCLGCNLQNTRDPSVRSRAVVEGDSSWRRRSLDTHSFALCLVRLFSRFSGNAGVKDCDDMNLYPCYSPVGIVLLLLLALGIGKQFKKVI